MSIDDNEAAVWQTLQDEGWSVPAVSKGRSAFVMFVMPGGVTPNGARSTDYEMTYWTADLPTLKEGDPITVAGVKYKVRDTPDVTAMPGYSRTGNFKHALLTALK